MSDNPVFDAAVAGVLAHEGGYQCRSDDSGNWTGGAVGSGVLKGTKYGISAASYPALDIAGLSEDAARDIYLRDWWQRLGLDRLPAAVAAKLLDAAVNTGAGPAVTALQRALRACGRPVVEDGRLGDETAAAAQAADGIEPALREALAGHYRLLAAVNPALAPNLAGWLNRAYS